MTRKRDPLPIMRSNLQWRQLADNKRRGSRKLPTRERAAARPLSDPKTASAGLVVVVVVRVE